MTPEEFRSAAHELIDWIVDHRMSIAERPVRAAVEPGDIAAQLPATPTADAEDPAVVLADLADIVAPGVTEVQHPMHFGWFPSNAALASVLGDIASSGIGSLGISWESSPALTEVEEVVVDWMRQLCGLSDAWKGVIQDTASTTMLVCMLAARERATAHAQAGTGLLGFGKRLCVYTTSEAHSSVRKAALLAGFAADDIRLVDIEAWSRGMSATALDAAINNDLDAGHVPAIVVASSGSTGTTAFDPLNDIGLICERHSVWMHVDAAMAGSAMFLPEQRHLFHGIERADSISWNPHKWLGTILDTSLMYVRDPEHLVRVMSTNPSYLQTTVTGSDGEAAPAEPTQFRDWGIPLGRRFRALKLWYHMRCEDHDDIRTRLRRDLSNAQWLADQFEPLPEWKLVAPVQLQTVVFRHEPADMSRDQISDLNHEIVRTINASGEAFLSPAQVDGVWTLRASIGVEPTERIHVERLHQLVLSTASQLRAARPC